MLHKAIRLVTFDVTHTLLHFRLSPGQQYAEVASSVGAKFDIDSVAQSFKNHYKEMCSQHPNFGKSSKMRWEEWWRHIVRNTFKPHLSDSNLVENIANRLIESYKYKDFWVLDEGCKDLLEFLKANGVVLGVISNFDPRLKEILTNMGIHKYFDFVLTSYESGYEKPDARIFITAMMFSRLIKLRPPECLHIGDDPVMDYTGARKAGWQAAILSNKSPDTFTKYELIQSENIFRDLSHLKKYMLDNKDIFENPYKI